MPTTLERYHVRCANDYLGMQENQASVCKSRFETGMHSEPSDEWNGNSRLCHRRCDMLRTMWCTVWGVLFLGTFWTSRKSAQSQGDLYDSCSLALTVTSTEKYAGSARYHNQRWKMFLRRAFIKATQEATTQLVITASAWQPIASFN